MAAFILMTAMTGGAAGGGGSCYPTTGVPSIFDACRTKLEAPKDKFVNTPPPQEGPLYLRLLCLSGTDLAPGDISGSSDPYVDVRFGGQVFCSPPQTATLNPVWDYLVETEVKEPGVMRITIYDQDWGCKGDKLGDCEIQIPKTPMKIKKETIRLRHVPSSFLKKAPNSRINVLYHIVDRLDDQADLLEMSKQMGEDGGEAATPQDYTVRIIVLEGSQLSFFLYNSTIEDLIQNRLKIEWILRKGNEDELDAAKSLYLRRPARDENSVPVTSVRVNIQDPIADAVAEERKLLANLSLGKGSDDEKQEGQDGEVDGERLAQARHSSAAEVAAPTAEARDNSELTTQNAKSKKKARKEKQTEAPFHGVPIHEEKTPQRSNNNKYVDELTLRRRDKKERRRAHAGQPESYFLPFGAWEFPLEEIRDFCVEAKVCAWAARAILLSASGMVVGEVLLHVDIFTAKETPRELVDLYHFPPPVQRGLAVRPPNLPKKKLEPSTSRARDSAAQAQAAAKESEAAPTTEEGKSKQRAQSPVRTPQNRDGTYYVYIYGDFFPKTDRNYNSCQWDNSDPFVTVSSPNCTDKTNSWSTTVKSNRQRECVWDPVPIRMPKNSRKQKLVLDVYDSDSPLLFGNSLLKEQVGSVRLLRANLGRPTWLHMYGGSFEGARGEFNSMMLKGGLDPPSTYHGSLCILVDNKRMRRQDWPPFPDKVGLPVRIEVQIARGLYLPGMYRQREVSLLVQVGGCLLELPDDADKEKRKRMGFLGLQATRMRTLTRDLEGIRSSRDMENIPDANFDILEFPGYVNSRGVLRLYNWSKPRAEMEGSSVEGHRRAGAGDSGYAERNATRDSLTGRDPCPQHDSCPSRLENDIDYPESLLNAWVKRISEPVYLLPKVQWVYLYIVAVGQEDTPPRLFCRLPLQGSGRVKRFLEGTSRTSADDNSWPPPQALLKAKERAMTRASFDNDDVSTGVEAPAGRDKAGEPVPPHPAVLLSERGTGFLGGESGTFRDSENLASRATIPEKMKWAQIHWDQSVTPLPPSRFPSTFAGCLLGQARAIITDDPARADFERKRAARNLPALDPDASVNPWWTIEVETEIVKFVPERHIDKELKILGSTANPSFLARTAVPVFLYTAPLLDSKALGPHSGEETAEASGARSRGDAPFSLESSSTSTDRCLSVPPSPKRASIPRFEDLLLPPPPIVVRLFDIDVLESGDLEKELISIVVDWDPANLDERQRTVGYLLRHQEARPPKLRQVSCEGGGDEREDHGKRLNASGGAHRGPREEREEDSPTDPNFDNEPVWYSLQDNQQLSFDVLERSVTLTNAWRAKPRLLASVGFSASACSPLADHLTSLAEQHWLAALNGMKSQPGARRVVESSRAASPALASQPEWAVYKLSAPEAVSRGETIQLLCYEIDVDLLGIRVVEAGGLEPSDYVLKVSSFWPDDPDKPLEFLLSGEDFPGPNVVCHFTDQPLKQKPRREAVSIPDSSKFRNSNQVVLPMRSAGITTVPGQWVGARISPPLFVTPYLPYLQALLPAKQHADAQEQDAQRPSQDEDSALVQRHRTARDVRSILPDINFRLIRRGGGDVGSLGISFNEYLNFPQGEAAIQLQILSPQLAKLPPPNMDRDIMTHYVFPELPCTTAANVDVLIECFAEATGDLLYDDDLLVGRMLTDHDVFFIRDPDAEGIIIHTFNADDYFVGCHDKRNTPFEEPPLKVSDVTDPGPSVGQYLDMMSVFKGRNGEKKAFLRAGTQTSTTQNQVAPQESSTSESAADQNRVRAALRTWIRKVGHRADPAQIGTCLLARLQILQTVYKTKSRRKSRSNTATFPRKSSFDREFEGTYNMVNIYTRHEGVVVWTNDQCEEGSTEKLFRHAGELILIFQSIHDRQFHRVAVPSFDIRYPAENGFFFLDSITESFEDLKKMALEQMMLRKVAQMKLLKRHSLAGESEEATALNVEIQELQHSIDALAPLVGGYLKTASRRAGFAQPLPVRRGQLVCRMKKFETMFDRTQTRIWYEPFGLLPPSNLSDYLKWGEEETKIAQVKGWVKVTNVTEQEALVRREASGVRSGSNVSTRKRLLPLDGSDPSTSANSCPSASQAAEASVAFHNCRGRGSSSLAWEPNARGDRERGGRSEERNDSSSTHKDEPRFKTCGEAFPADSESDAGSTSLNASWNARDITAPIVTIAPPMQGWIVQTVVVHAYILTGRNLLNVDWWWKSDPFLRLSIGDQAVTSEKVFSNNDSPDFYEHFVFPVLIPGVAKLKIAVMDRGNMLAADSTIGEAVIDLEERQLISKDKEMFLPPLLAFPLEYVALQKSHEDDDFGVSCGTLRCMVDLVVDGAPYEPLVINDLGSTHAFELRVVIWDVTDISVFKGASGERNDLKVRMELFLTGIDLQDTYEVYYTDVHLFAKTTATYNWRIVKKVNLPVAALSLKFALIDNNAVYDEDTLYAPESLSLDALTYTTVTKIQADEALLDPLDYTIGFDEPMGQGMVEMWCQSYWCAPFEAMGCPTAVTSCCNRRDMDDDFFGSAPQPAPFSSWLKLVCCGRSGYLRRVRRTTNSPAHLHCTVALIPQDVAEAHPAGQGRSAPDALPEPTDRPSPNLMFTDPVAYLNLIVGQQTCALIKASTACFCGVLFLGIIAFVIAVIVIAARMP
ncbi:UNVERIFIED_CONTAM: C2 domain-containing protein [Hammondia hammondi]|eukprot:XP_008888147.1 C2 domain-containing protein [Hammondia hammondi]